MFNSVVQQRSAVAFPAFTGERLYMIPFMKKEGLPSDLIRWQPTVDAMLEGIETDQPIYMMVDQTYVKAGHAQRRPGVHIDGYWRPELRAHKQPNPGRHITNLASGWKDPGWCYTEHGILLPEALVLASNVQGCRAFIGDYEGEIGKGGDCTHLDLSGLDEVWLDPNVCYAGNVTMLHESMPVAQDCQRTLVRLSVPGWSPELH